MLYWALLNLYSHIISYPWYDRCYIGSLNPILSHSLLPLIWPMLYWGLWNLYSHISLTLDMTDVILGLWNLYSHILFYPWYDRCYIGSLEPIFSHSLLPLIGPMLYWVFGTYNVTFSLTLDRTDVTLGLWNLYSHILSYPWYDRCYIGSFEPIFSHSLLPLIGPMLYWVCWTYILTLSLTLDMTDVILGSLKTYILTLSLTLDMTDVILGLWNLYSHILSYSWYDRCYIGSLEPIFSHSLYPWYDRCYIGSLEPIFSHSHLPLIWPMLYWVFWTYILSFSLTLDMTDVILGLWNLYSHILSYPWYDRCYIGSLEPIFSHCLLPLIWLMLYWVFGTYIIGRFYYDKSTKTLYKYSHDRLEIKDIRCIHQGIEREKKKGWQPIWFAECVDIKLEEEVQLMYHLKIYLHSTCIIVVIIIHIICMILT